MLFYPGLHQPSDARHFDRCFISYRRLVGRRSNFRVKDWILDSGAFTELEQYGHYRHSPETYARAADRWTWCGNLLAAISQDYMCESWMLEKTGLTISDHQRLTIERYDAICACARYAYVMPVLQGYAPTEYVDHIAQYGDRLQLGAWVGVGSVCKRQGDPAAIRAVLRAIKAARPDLRLHGFGVKITSLANPDICALLHTADSLAWSLAARKQGRNANDWREARQFTDHIEQLIVA